MKKSLSLLFIISIIVFNVVPTKVYSIGEYLIVDTSNKEKKIIENYDDFDSANYYYLNHLDDYDNLVLYKGDEVLKMEYGIVEFNSDDACQLNLEYYSILNKEKTSINACYGVDGAYLYSSDDASRVYFKYSGDIGYINKEDVKLHPYELIDKRISNYENINGILNHKIKTQLELDYYAYALELDDSLSFLKDNQDYYSYDGHYFYDNFYKMIDDYQNDNYDHSINFNNPYYNYYQYLPYRSLTNYDYKEIEDYFYNTLMIDGKLDYYDDLAKDGANDVVNKSQYYGDLKAFFQYQNLYGVNALMALAVSVNESSYGKSFKAYSQNNLFTNSAYDSDEERINNHYSSIEDSIYAYFKYYVSDRYCNYRNSLYHGSFFGNKLSGMNKEYSIDAYWGEKAASNYFKIDKALNSKDYNSYALGIINNKDRLNFYSNEDLNKQRFNIININDYSLIILNEGQDYYKVQVDPSFNSEYLYDFDECNAYIRKDNFDYLFNEEKIHENEMIEIIFDLNEGEIIDKNVLNIKVLKGLTPIIVDPKYDGYEFVGFNEELIKAENNKTYYAEYKKIKDIKLNNKINNTIELGKYFDLRDIYLTITYEDNHKKRIPVDSNMLRNINIYKAGKQSLTITYKGLSIIEDIDVSKYLNDINKQTNELIKENIDNYLNDSSINEKDLNIIKNNLDLINYSYDFKEIRILDEMLLKINEDTNYHIDNNEYDLSISGMALSFQTTNRLFLFKPFIDIYHVNIKRINNNDRLNKIGLAYGFKKVDCFKISFERNLVNTTNTKPLIISLKIDDKDAYKTYVVYRLDENNDVIKCRTTQSKSYIQFLTDKPGKFILLVKDNVNDYDIEDYKENLNSLNNSINYQGFVVVGTLGLAIIIYGIILIIVYQNIERLKAKKWKDYKKLLLKADIVQEEKLKN